MFLLRTLKQSVRLLIGFNKQLTNSVTHTQSPEYHYNIRTEGGPHDRRHQHRHEDQHGGGKQ